MRGVNLEQVRELRPRGTAPRAEPAAGHLRHHHGARRRDMPRAARRSTHHVRAPEPNGGGHHTGVLRYDGGLHRRPRIHRRERLRGHAQHRHCWCRGALLRRPLGQGTPARERESPDDDRQEPRTPAGGRPHGDLPEPAPVRRLPLDDAGRFRHMAVDPGLLPDRRPSRRLVADRDAEERQEARQLGQVPQRRVRSDAGAPQPHERSRHCAPRRPDRHPPAVTFR